MQLLIVLVAALACVSADPQYYTTGYKTVVPGYTGVVGHPGFPAGVKPVAYTGQTYPVGYAGQTYPVGYAGQTYPVGYTGLATTSYPVGNNAVVDVIHRARREALAPLTAYTHPGAYSATPYTYKSYSPIAYSPVGGVPAQYNYGYTYPVYG